jgi:hypothetical protein
MGPVAKLEKVCSEREEQSGNDKDEAEDRRGAEGEDCAGSVARRIAKSFRIEAASDAPVRELASVKPGAIGA